MTIVEEAPVREREVVTPKREEKTLKETRAKAPTRVKQTLARWKLWPLSSKKRLEILAYGKEQNAEGAPKKADALTDFTITIPTPEQPDEASVDKLRLMQTEKKVRTTKEAFLRAVCQYMDLKPGSHSEPDFVERAIRIESQNAVGRDPQLIRRTLHVQLLRLIDKYDHIGLNDFLEDQHTTPTKTINRLKGFIGMYMDKTPEFRRLVDQRKFPDYNDRFRDTMGAAIDAFEDWDKVRPKHVVTLPTEPDQELLNNEAYNNQFADKSDAGRPKFFKTRTRTPFAPPDRATTEFYSDRSQKPPKYVRRPRDPRPLPSEQHPDQETLQDTEYNKGFIGKPGTKPRTTYKVRRGFTPPPAHPEHPQLADQTYLGQFADQSEKPPRMAEPLPIRETPLPEHPDLPDLATMDMSPFADRTPPPKQQAETQQQPAKSEPKAKSREEAIYADRSQRGLK